MELDELKTLINHKLATDHASRTADDIAAMLTRRTASVIDKLKRSLWIEIACCILVILVFGYVGITGRYQSFRIYFSVFAVLSLIFLGIVIHLLKRIKELSATTLPVKSNLQTIEIIISEFSRRYFQFTMALIPVCLVFSFFLGYSDREQIPEMDKFIHPNDLSIWKILAIVIVYFGALSAGVYYFTKWYLRKLYGRYLEQLRECIAELSDE